MMFGLLLIIVPLLLGLWAQYKVHSALKQAQAIPASCGLSGAEVAQEICRAHGINDVKVEPSQGFLSDHYDPSSRTLRLSPDIYDGRSVAALGIAAHEAGHALQHAQHYGPLALRNTIVPAAQLGGYAANFAIMGGMLLMAFVAHNLGVTVLLFGVAGLMLVAAFQLITLPVEFDASRRAKDILTSTGLVLPGREATAMSRVLDAAALTYVAALVSTIGTILYYLLIIFGGSRRN